MADDSSPPDDLRSLVEHLVSRVENLQAAVDAARASPAARMTGRRTHPAAREPEELADLALWVDGLQRRYAAAGDWLRPCWWRHGFVVEELAALREAWLAIYDSDEPADPTAAIRWHEEAERCRERIRRTISAGPGCTAVAHKADQPVTDDPRWVEEQIAQHDRSESGSSGPHGCGLPEPG